MDYSTFSLRKRILFDGLLFSLEEQPALQRNMKPEELSAETANKTLVMVRCWLWLEQLHVVCKTPLKTQIWLMRSWRWSWRLLLLVSWNLATGMASWIYRTFFCWPQSFSPLFPRSTARTSLSLLGKPPTAPVGPSDAPIRKFHVKVRLYLSTTGCSPATTSSSQYSTSTLSSSGPYLTDSSSLSQTSNCGLNCKKYQ